MVGGVAKYLKNICANLPADKVVVYAPTRPDSFDSDKKRPYKVIRDELLSKNVWPAWLPLIWRIYRLAKTEAAELLQVGQVLPIGTAVYLLTRVWRRPYIVYTHGMDITLPQTSPIKKLLVKTVLRAAYKVITNSSFTRNVLLNLGVPETKIVTVNPGAKVFDVFADTRALGVETLKKYDLIGKRILLTVGRVVERKGHDTVIRALPKIVEKFPNLIYVVVGAGPSLESLKELVAKMKLTANVFFAGEVTDKQKIVWYDLCEVFVMTPRQLSNFDVEGFGIVYLEANGLGKPVVGSASGGVTDAVVDNLNGIIVPPDDVEKTAEAIVRLLTDHELAKRLGEQGRKRAMDNFSWPAQAQKIKDILT